jgi:hypothetical protein
LGCLLIEGERAGYCWLADHLLWKTNDMNTRRARKKGGNHLELQHLAPTDHAHSLLLFVFILSFCCLLYFVYSFLWFSRTNRTAGRYGKRVEVRCIPGCFSWFFVNFYFV